MMFYLNMALFYVTIAIIMIIFKIMYNILKVRLSFKGLTKTLPHKSEVEDIEEYRKELGIKHSELIKSFKDEDVKPRILIDYEERGN